MQKQLMILAISAVAISSQAKDAAFTNGQPASVSTNSFSPANTFRPRKSKGWRPEDGGRFLPAEGRRLQLMERELNRIGVTEEERAQITALQKSYREKMKANALRIEEARSNLTGLLDAGAPMEAIDAAILDVSAAMTDQIRLLVMNRIEMERILGKKKHDQFMENARRQYQKHGRHAGAPLPPRPAVAPPAPEQQTTPESTPPPQ